MNKTFLVAHREYLENVKTKGFWIGILVFPLILTLFIVVPELLERTKGARQFAVIDQSGWLLEAVERRVIAADLTRAFQVTATRYTAGESLDDFPSLFRDAASVLADLDPAELAGIATAIVGRDNLTFQSPSGARGAPDVPASAAALVEQRDAFRAWWRELSSAEARVFPGISKRQYQRITVPEEGDATTALNAMIRDGELFAYFVIEQDPVNGEESSRYVSNNLTDDELKDWFARIASDVIRARRLQQERIDPAVARWIQDPLRFDERKVTLGGIEEEVQTQDTLRQWAPVIFVYLLWISVFTVSQMLLTNTIEEKSNRTIEVLLSSISPLQLMGGKISGIAATGLTVVGSWIVFFFIATKIIPVVMGTPASLDLSVLATDPLYIGSFIAYFVLGYLLYAALLVGIGSVVNTLKEAQNLMTPVTLLLIAPLLAMVPIGRDPNGTLAKLLSYFPPFTPFVMMNRAAGPPTIAEYVLTTLLLVVSIGAAMWAAAKVFRIGILLTGKPPRPTEILRWIKAPVGAVPAGREAARHEVTAVESRPYR